MRWLPSGREYFAALADAIQGASESVRFECYIVRADAVGNRVRDFLADAAGRGARVHVLVDAFGSNGLPGDFWAPLLSAGGSVRLFNPLGLRRMFVRDHRKLIVIDRRAAYAGGFNIASEYAGDGVASGWADCAVEVQGHAAAALAGVFDLQWEEAAAGPPAGGAFGVRRRPMPSPVDENVQVIVSGPGLTPNGLQVSLRSDLALAREVRLASAYFLPGTRLRAAIQRAAWRGARVRLLLSGPTDVQVARRAARHLYGKLLRAGVEIYEYQPQIFHAKLYILDSTVYAGSSNLDIRSLYLNYELILRLADPEAAAGAAAIFDDWLSRSVRIDRAGWRASRSFVDRARDRLAYWLLARVDPFVTRRFDPDSASGARAPVEPESANSSKPA